MSTILISNNHRGIVEIINYSSSLLHNFFFPVISIKQVFIINALHHSKTSL